MDYSSLPQPLPRLIPADQILPIMKRIVGQYQTVRENIIESVDVQKAKFDNLIQPLIDIDNETQGDIAIIAMLRYSSPDPASRQASEEACALVNEDQAAFTARSDFWPLLKAVKEACQEISLHFEARKYLDKLFLEFKQFGHGTLQPVPRSTTWPRAGWSPASASVTSRATATSHARSAPPAPRRGRRAG